MRKLSRREYVKVQEAVRLRDGADPVDAVRRPRRRIPLFWIALSVLVVSFFGALGVLFSMLNAYLEDLPQLSVLEQYRPARLTKVRAADATLLAELYDPQEGRRELVALEDVAEILREAVLASEDARFYSHPGIDVYRVLGALRANMRSGDWTGQGASTITMQIPRNLGLTKRRKNLQRKIEDTLLALEIERLYSKNEILEIYLNQVYLGQNSYGVEQAAQSYFGKSAKEVNLPEAALLVGLLKSPSRDNPYRWPERARARRNATIRRLETLGKITPEESRAARSAPIEVVQRRERTRSGPRDAPYFVKYVEQWLSTPGRFADTSVAVRPPDGSSGEQQAIPLTRERIYTGGYLIRTTVDLALQDAARSALQQQIVELERIRRKHPSWWGGPAPAPRALADRETYDARILEVSGEQLRFALVNTTTGPKEAWMRIDREENWLADFGVLEPGYHLHVRAHREDDGWRFVREPEAHLQGCIVALEVATGRIVALVGGYDFHSRLSRGRWFNRATQARRQPGSAFKPIVYAAALEHGYTLQSLIDDQEMEFQFGGRVWAPKNFDKRTHGAVTVRDSLAHSYNLASIDLLMNLTRYSDEPGSWTRNMRVLRSFAEDLGLQTLSEARLNLVGLSLALGTAEVRPIELLAAYAAFANNGLYIEPYGVERITDQEGFEVYEHRPLRRQAVSPAVAAAMTDALHSVVEYGTGRRAQELGVPVVGKTGTTDMCTDAWFIGYSSGLAVCAYIGFDLKRPMGEGSSFQGSRAALPAWIEFMKAARDQHPEWFGEFAPLHEGMEVTVCLDSLDRATSLCPRTRTVFCTPGMQPTRTCRLHGGPVERSQAPDDWLQEERRQFQLPMPFTLQLVTEMAEEEGEPAWRPPAAPRSGSPRQGTIKALPPSLGEELPGDRG